MAVNTALGNRITVYDGSFDASRFTEETSLVKANLHRVEELTPTITMLYGSWNNTGDQFPLLSLTEGREGGIEPKASKSIEYTYPVIGKRKTTEEVAVTAYSASDKPGIGHSEFFVDFKSNWFPIYQSIMSPDGTLARVSNYTRNGNYWRYALKLHGAGPADYIDYTQLVAGTTWGIVGGGTVAHAGSWGNRGRVQNPGKRKNQISFLRQSYELGGNIANKVVEFQLFDEAGNPTRKWVSWYEFQQMINWRKAKEEHLWTSLYNRDEFGRIGLIDDATGFPIPTGAGLKQQIVNNTTYTRITDKLMNMVVGDVFRGVPDHQKMDIVCYCGTGFEDEFDRGMKNSTAFRLVAQSTGDKFVRSVVGGLQLGGYFKSYLTVEGHAITLKRLPFLDLGGYAERSGRHPVSGRYLSSYEAYFIDQSTYDNEKNIKYVYEDGRMEVRGLHQGMALIKGSSYGDYNGNGAYLNLATEQDVSSIHFMGSCGVQMMRDTHSFALYPGFNF